MLVGTRFDYVSYIDLYIFRSVQLKLWIITNPFSNVFQIFQQHKYLLPKIIHWLYQRLWWRCACMKIQFNWSVLTPVDFKVLIAIGVCKPMASTPFSLSPASQWQQTNNFFFLLTHSSDSSSILTEQGAWILIENKQDHIYQNNKAFPYK